jgi:hypothetical protein
MGTCIQEPPRPQRARTCAWSAAGPVGRRRCSWSRGEKLFCPICREKGKIEGAKDAMGREYMLGKYGKKPVQDWRATRKKLGITAPQWLLDKERVIVTRADKARVRGDGQ